MAGGDNFVLKYGTCGRCERRFQRGDTEARTPLPADDFCGPCGRPVTERGTQLSDQAGFLALARAISGRRPAQSRTHNGQVKLAAI